MTQITIAGKQFEVNSPYSEGHVLNAAEAKTLNQTRHENVRNNMAKLVRDNPDSLDQSALQAAVSEYDTGYVFGARATGGGGFSRDPVLTEARSIARIAIRDKRKSEGKDALNKEDMAEKIEAVLAGPASAKIMALAQERVAHKQNAAASLLDDVAA
jgi:hypothetical protein